MEKEYDFTIITVCFNAGDIVEETIKSVIFQENVSLQYIIIDGVSADNTLNIVNRYKDSINIVISEKDNGIYDAMNKGIRLAKGKYVNFMNAGDRFVDNHILEKVKKNKGADIIFGDVIVNHYNLYYIYKSRPFYEHLPLNGSMGFTHQSTFVKNEIIKKNEFDLRYRLAADYNMMISLYKQNYSFEYLDMPISYYDLNGASNSKDHIIEVLNIDHPNNFISNKIKAEYIYIKRKINILIKAFIFKINPNILERHLSNNERYIKLDSMNEGCSDLTY